MTAQRFFGKVSLLLEMIKFAHTIFALPFTLMSVAIAMTGGFDGRALFWIVAAMVGARTSAMTFNRIIDRGYDALNPRTASRALPKGAIKTGEAWLFLGAATALFVLAAAMLNRLALALSPVALLVIWGYSYTKRFTVLSHLFLGLALAIAPTGAWIAARGRFDWPPVLLSLCVLLWTAGFDIIYACQDVDFDRKTGLYSLPAAIGVGPALHVSLLLHLLTIAGLVALKWVAGLGPAYLIGAAAASVLLLYEHTLVKPGDLSRVNAAFFTINGFVSIGLFVFTLIARWLA
ncbi:MAG: UbiA family prenyltransferase [Armatimonadetes bacterium]|nr:UbiA family prenyltransferase [Armatimonadota bacterium]